MIPLCFGNVIELIIYLNNYEIHPDTLPSPPHPTAIKPSKGLLSPPKEILRQNARACSENYRRSKCGITQRTIPASKQPPSTNATS